jgi:regulator of sirC expression with transglutaminase-like and TPR domain
MDKEDHDIDLIEAALLIAAQHHGEFNSDKCLDQLATLSEEAHDHIKLDDTDINIGRGLCDFLHKQARYSGDHQDYYNPDNSYFDRVLTRRKGIPITLALVYISIGQRLGLCIEPVGFPGHFLVKLVGKEEVILDPFSGQVLSNDDCRDLLSTCTQDSVTFHHQHLDTVSNREVVQRLLNNLKGIYLNSRAPEEALGVCDQLLIIDKDSPRDLMDRAAILEHMDCHSAAAEDLAHLLTLGSPPQIASTLRKKIDDLRSKGSKSVH